MSGMQGATEPRHPVQSEERAEPPPASGETTARTRLLVALWALCILLPLVVRLGAAPLFDVDEGAFAEATREMVASGDYGFPTLDGAPRFDKPILVYWLQAASVRAFGLSEWALRLPSALSVWLWCLAVAAFAGRRWGRRTGLLAGTVLATSVGPLIIGRACTADGLLNLLLALALLDGWRFLESRRRAPLLRAYLWIGLGLLTKGPIALLVPAAVSTVHLLCHRRPREWVRVAFDPVGWLVLLLVAGPWYAYALHLHGAGFVNGFLLKHNIARFTSTMEHHGGSVMYYVPILPVLLLPWSALLASAVRSLWRGSRGSLDAYLLVWCGFVLAFFSLSGTKLPHYALYGSTPLVLGIAIAANDASARVRTWVAGTTTVLLLLLVMGPWFLPAVSTIIRDPLYAALLREPGSAWPLQLGAAGGLLASSLAWRRWGPTVPVLSVCAAALSLVVSALGTPWLGETLQSPVKHAALVARALRQDTVQWDVRIPSFSLYRGEATPRGDPAPGQLAITNVSMLAGRDSSTRVLFQERGYALVLLDYPRSGWTQQTAEAP